MNTEPWCARTKSASPLQSIMVEPLPELVKKDGGGARYKSVGYAEFMRRFFSAKLDGRKSHLDHFRIY